MIQMERDRLRNQLIMQIKDDETDKWLEIIDRSGLDLSDCMLCGCPVICIPDGLPMCGPCAAKEMNAMGMEMLENER